MATGRGKSLIFQVYAALIALKEGQASLFVYPLRALMADQAFHISQQFEKFGLKCAVLNGETSQSERCNIYSCLKCGDVDIVLTTPEYLSFHCSEISESNRIGFLVVDEAHHIGQARAGQRSSYLELGDVVKKLGHPVVLAVTATAPEEVASTIRETLPLESEIFDEASRDNLHVNDQRNIAHRDDYLAQLIASGGKTVIYVNSREQSVAVARRERQRVPQLAPYIGFYNAGLSREERKHVEDLFRNGEIQVLVATSAFGEGIDIPDIRNVVLYHMPFNAVEFNQMAGRAGRDGKSAWVHLLYGKRDASINENILNDMTPPREVMAVVYRTLCDLQRSDDINLTHFTIQELAERLTRVKLQGREFSISKSAIGCGLNVFSELGLISHVSRFSDGTTIHQVSVSPEKLQVELTDSTRYCEGLSEITSFELFREWALNSTLEQLTFQVTHPITPAKRGV
jgi:single-stranded-DNA-specific exonuclease